MKPHAQILVDTYQAVWDGSNWRGESSDAEAYEREHEVIQALVDACAERDREYVYDLYYEILTELFSAADDADLPQSVTLDVYDEWAYVWTATSEPVPVDIDMRRIPTREEAVDAIQCAVEQLPTPEKNDEDDEG